ncbi:MAG: alpha/beta hydrolase [Bacteroidia bacterium]|nr:MAG: alpha/beta hydrolase [Bacteroidia bacterium]
MGLYYEKLGSGEPAFVFLHGLLGSLDNWRTVAKSLRLPGSRLLVDARNHGRSPHFPSHTYPEMAQDLLDLFTAEGLEQAHLLGHSMGGKTAMYVALHFPRRVQSLVVVDIAPRAYPGGHEPILEALARTRLDLATRREEVEAQLATTLHDPTIRQFLLKGLARDAEGRFFWRWNLPVLQRDYAHISAAVEGPPYPGPALFLRGERSPYIRPQDEAEIRRLFPAAQMETLPRAGHWVHADNPSAVIQALERFWGAQL